MQIFNPETTERRPNDQIDKENMLITGFKRITEQTGAVILLISQKNKASFNTSGGLQSIKGSVDIVYTADTIMFLDTAGEKESRTNKNTNDELDEIMKRYDPNMDLIIESRDNPHATIPMKFNGEHSEFIEV